MLKIKKLDARGVAHHIFIPLLAISLIAGAGAYVVSRSNASTAYTNGPIYTGNSFVRSDGTKEQHVSYYSMQDSSEWIHKPVFSPDGTKVAYVDRQAGSYALKTMTSNGMERKVIYKPGAESIAIAGGAGIGRVTWSSDSKYIAFLQTLEGGPFAYDPDAAFSDVAGSLTVVRADGTTGAEDSYQTISMFPKTKPEGSSWFSHSGVQFMPGTTKIAYIAGVWGGTDSQLCTVDINVQAEPVCKVITGPTGNFKIPEFNGSDFRVSNKGEGLFTAAAGRSLPDEGYDEQYFKLDLITAQATTLGSARYATHFNGWFGFDIEWSPDGTQIAYQHDEYTVSDPSMAGTFVMDSNGQNIKKISDSSHQLTWQPIPVGGKQAPLPINEQTISCSVDGPLNTFVPGVANQIKITVNNHGLGPFQTALTGTYNLYQGSTAQYAKPLSPVTTPQIDPDGSVVVSMPVTVPTAVSTTDSMYVDISTATGARCSGSFPLPPPVISLSTPLTQTVPYAGVLTVKGKTTSPNAPVALYVVGRGTTNGKADAYGNFTLTGIPTKDTTYYVTGAGSKSPTAAVKVSPVVTGALTRSVKKGTKVTASGKYTPGTTIKIHVRKPGDPAGTYPRVYNVAVNSTGNFAFSYTADTTKAFYFSAPNGTKTPVYVYKIY